MKSTKQCSVCGEVLSLEAFYNLKASKDGKAYRCKECDTKAGKNYRKKNTKALSDSRRKANYKHKYGVTTDQVDQMVADQSNKCAICGEEGFKMSNKVKHKLVLDHCHTSGKVRGMLCNNCNRGLGLFQDNTEYLKNAITYLEIH